MASIKQTFFQECEEQLVELESGLLKIEAGECDAETVNAVFRAVHSIKGGAGAFGFEQLVEFVHVFETTLDLLRSNKITATPSLTKTLLRASDVLSDLVRAAREDSVADAHAARTIAAELSALHGDAPAGGHEEEEGLESLEFQPVAISLDSIFDIGGDDAGPAMQDFIIRFRPGPGLYAKANETVRLLRELARLGETTVECDTHDVPLLSELDPEGAYLSWTIRLTTSEPEARVREIFEFVEWDCELDVSAADVGKLLEAFQEALEPIEAPAPAVGETIAPRIEAAAPAPAPAPIAAPSEDEHGHPSPAKPEAQRSDGAAAAQTTIRVDLDRVDRLINLVGELVINQAMLSQRVSEAGLSRASSVAIGLDELEQLTRDIQDSVMAIRAQPVKPVFQRMSRTVREVAAMTGKSVRLVMDGEGTEVDKTVIERLTDPLTHMIRNAVDHGVEKPEDRIAAGKPEEGSLRLSATHRSGRIVIEVADDGAGINRARVRQIAVDKGLIPAEANLTDEEIDNLIFLPGFSTASTVSNISGRGVGMDVVKRAIQALGGRMSISSVPGRGSTFSMSLPLTLAVLDGMVVTVGGQTLVVPLTAIIETLQPKKESVHELGNGARVIASRAAFTPLIDVGMVLMYRYEPIDPTSQVALLVESESGAKCALLVDAIQGQRQVVIKSLETNYGHVHGIAAATILGDGRVALILDVDAIIGRPRADLITMDAMTLAAE
ncbi:MULTISPECIES: chemotaxis protein CheA [Methylosinus]|uniref:chemotaxis protein CheA n=1 Tax=Methylosinus TaxID=425 RepID=UPI00058DB42F|nr:MULTISPECIES: chemotaxis protein CheA [Methylosinus]OBS52351.1 chemotaxis protein CheA [Methylosinus sp. 3S-1]